MSYLNVLPLATVKDYLRIDDTQNETDAEITSMIRSSLSYIEKHTNIILYARDKEYDVEDYCVKVYDYPINSLIVPLEATTVKKSLYTNYTINTSDETIKLNVGYTDVSDVPTELLDLAKVMVKVMFYEQETNQSFKEMLPQWANDILCTNKRFLV